MVRVRPVQCKPVMFTQVARGTLRITAVLSIWWPHSMGLTHWPAQGSNAQLRCCYSSSASAQPATTCVGDTPIDAAAAAPSRRVARMRSASLQQTLAGACVDPHPQRWVGGGLYAPRIGLSACP
eukprot:CAMPEP_0179460100 /NCGR_PEP_ID=MMETSP0799-20121207/43259_1 /TAXON_ID=46947 /ORGANISM="Geminigera cryophila, Strain CCMP2564" /LENGTH=123 /DNA_ID=CAMNT_0021262231 /DNA_START=493 /DNA_END=862 /DNA_ORIENTATION=-